MIIALTSLLLGIPLLQQPSSKQDRGYIAAKFATRTGGVTVYLPNDMAPGDAVSGTVFVDTRSDDLRDLQVDIGGVRGVRPSPTSAIMKWIVPGDARDGIPLIVRRKDGSQVGFAKLPISPSPGKLDAFTFPTFVQTGRQAVIWGPFDGDAARTKLKIKDFDASILAESPRSMVCYVPYDTPAGPVSMTLSQSGGTAKAEVRAIAVDISTPRIDLDKGEKAIVTVKIDGLTGLNEATVPYIQVQNMSPKIIDLEGKAVQVIIPKVNADGKYTHEFTAICKTSGSFLITTFVEPGPGVPVLPRGIGL